MEVHSTSLSRFRSTDQYEKGPGQRGGSYLSLVFPFLQLSLFVHHHSRDRHVGVLLSGLPDGLGQRLPGSGESTVSGGIGSFSGCKTQAHWSLGIPHWATMVLPLCLGRQGDLKGLTVHFRGCFSFPQSPHFSGPFLNNNVEETCWLWIPPVPSPWDLGRTGLTWVFAPVTWVYCAGCTGHFQACFKDGRGDVQHPAQCLPCTLITLAAAPSPETPGCRTRPRSPLPSWALK